MTRTIISLAAAALLATGLSACDNDRSAESKTPVAEAEVETKLPEEALSDQALQQTADQAAAQASTPAPGTTMPSGGPTPPVMPTTPPTR